ncbi:MAG: hypothetical protein JXR96_13575 [Deltaproteobacteria bacterium]|nr:hypothetical protein [Deltaproteobacteria bacterium]
MRGIRVILHVILSLGLCLFLACSSDTSEPTCDEDGDGYDADTEECGGVDCDDGDASIHPNADEICGDGVDQDCSGSDLQCNCEDADEDGYLDADCGGDDCDDGDAETYPGADEVCDSADNDCNGTVDDMGDQTCGVGVCENTVVVCANGRLQECTPLEPTEVHEGSCDDGLDNDCDDLTDDADPDCNGCADRDGDGYLDQACGGTDCDDTDEDVNPDAEEICNNQTDDDCNPDTPDIFDGDSDGEDCDTDCNDDNAAIFHDQTEDCDNDVDDDCDDDVDCDDLDCEEDDACLLCGNGDIDPDEECDDGNDCKYDGCSGCRLEPSAVAISFRLDDNAGYDLDNLDGDNNIHTGVDNVFGSSGVFNTLLNMQLGDSIDGGYLIQLITIGDLDNVPWDGTGTPGFEEDEEIVVSLYPGVDPACPPRRDPVPWVNEANAPWEFYSNLDYFDGCYPSILITEVDDPFNGIHPANNHPREPEAPFVHAHREVFQVDTGYLGLLDIYNAYMQATVENNGTIMTALTNGNIGGKIPVDFIYRIDLTDNFGDDCPTALHAVLGYVGNMDQDLEGNGTVDVINFQSDSSVPCMFGPVIIESCVDDETGTVIQGEDCFLDPSIGDGYSSGFEVEAVYASVSDQVSGRSYCP